MQDFIRAIEAVNHHIEASLEAGVIKFDRDGFLWYPTECIKSHHCQTVSRLSTSDEIFVEVQFVCRGSYEGQADIGRSKSYFVSNDGVVKEAWNHSFVK